MISSFYWAQLFRNTSLYVTMIKVTFYDIRYFILMVVLVITSFAVAIYIVDNKQRQLFEDGLLDGDYEFMQDEKTPVEFLDAWVTQYLLMLGEFEIFEVDSDHYE